MRWNNNGAPPLYEHAAVGAELVFGASTPGGSINQVILTVDRDDDPWLYAFDMDSGGQNWAVQRGVTEDGFLQYQIQPETGPDGTVYMTEFIGSSGLGWALWAFDGATGERLWHYDPNILSSASGPEAGSDGTIYFSWDISRVSAVSPAGQPLWTHVDFNGVRTQPTIAPDNSVAMVGGGNFGVSGTFKTLNAETGEELWKIQLPDESGNIVPDTRPLITPDSAIAYWPTLILADSDAFPYCYLYALDVQEPAPAIGDLSGDGIVGPADLAELLAQWGACPAKGPCPADIAPSGGGDGVVGPADLAELLANWN